MWLSLGVDNNACSVARSQHKACLSSDPEKTLSPSADHEQQRTAPECLFISRRRDLVWMSNAFTADDWTAMMDFADHHLLNKKTDRRFDRFPTEAELDAAPAAARAPRPAPAAAKQFPLP